MAQSFPIRLRTLAATIVVIASGLSIFYAYQGIMNSTDETPQALPIIHADATPFRVLPENPGGAGIPNQGSKLFNVMDANQDDPLALNGTKLRSEELSEPETLFEDDTPAQIATGFHIPEAIETRTESLYGIIEDLKDRPEVIEDDVEPELESVPETVQMDTADKEDLEVKLKTVIKQVEANIVQHEFTSSHPQPLAKPQISIKKSAPKIKTTDKNKFALDKILGTSPKVKKYYIQLASLRDQKSARSAYARIKAEFSKLFKGVGVVYPSVDLGSRGKFTRIQAGPLSEPDARQKCSVYSASPKGGTCLVISR